MATNYLGTGTFLANTTVTAFYGVVISNNRGVGLSTTGSCDGFALTDAASGDYVSVAFLTNNGTLKGTITAAPVTVGDTIYLGSQGEVWNKPRPKGLGPSKALSAAKKTAAKAAAKSAGRPYPNLIDNMRAARGK